jgi:phospholipid N-methyltransferase
MKGWQFARRLTLALTACAAIATSVFAQQTQTQTKPFEPTVGQAGKDVVWVPTSQVLVDKMLDLAKVSSNDVVYDLGSGDGRTVITAAKRGARAVGVEYNPDMVALSRKNAAAAGVAADRATFKQADLFATDFSEATVVTMFLLPDINLRLRPTILNMKPGTRIVSNTFTMAEWEPDESQTVTEGCQTWCTALFWVVPAKVEGAWRMPQGELTISQTFQKLTGTIKNGANSGQITNGRMRGDQISFTAGGVNYTGRVNGNSIQGTMSGGSSGNWSATRAGG